MYVISYSVFIAVGDKGLGPTFCFLAAKELVSMSAKSESNSLSTSYITDRLNVGHVYWCIYLYIFLSVKVE